MRVNVVFALTSMLGMTEALRRGCRVNRNNRGEGWYYTAPGDTLAIVAADFCTTPQIINQWSGRNDAPNAPLPGGINLKVPCRERRRDCRRNTPDGFGAYVIVSGDTLDDISRDFCTDSDTVTRQNSHRIQDKNIIFPGWQIQVPCSWNQ